MIDTLAIAVQAINELVRYTGLSPVFVKNFEVQPVGHSPDVLRVGNVETRLFAYITREA